MYRLFTEQLFRGRKISNDFMMARTKFQDTIEKSVRYFRQHGSWINNSHPLVRLVSGLSIDPKQADGATYRRVYSASDEIAAGLGITTFRNRGDFHDETFYGGACLLVLAEFTPFVDLPSDWTQWAAVRPLTHQFVNLQPVMPHQIEVQNPTDYSVVGVDIPMLVLQYKLFLKEESKKPEAEREGTKHFLTKYVIPNMLPYQTDIAIRNRFLMHATGAKRIDVYPDLPFFTILYENELDKGIKELLVDMRSKSPTFSEVTEAFPMIHAEVYADAVPTVLQMQNIYSYWATFLIYLDWTFPVFRCAERLDVDQENIKNKVSSIKRFLNASGALRQYGTLLPKIEARWDYIDKASK